MVMPETATSQRKPNFAAPSMWLTPMSNSIHALPMTILHITRSRHRLGDWWLIIFIYVAQLPAVALLARAAEYHAW